MVDEINERSDQPSSDLVGAVQQLVEVVRELKDSVDILKQNQPPEQSTPMAAQDVVRNLTHQESLSVEVQDRMRKRLEDDSVKLNQINDALIRGRR